MCWLQSVESWKMNFSFFDLFIVALACVAERERTRKIYPFRIIPYSRVGTLHTNCTWDHQKKSFGSSFGRHSFLRWWGVGVFLILKSWGLLLLRSKLFYCLLLLFKPIVGEVSKKCRGLDPGPLKISRIGKTPTPHHPKNAALPFSSVVPL